MDLFLTSVTGYGADVFVADGQERVHLWDKVSGYDTAGLDYLRAIISRRLAAAVPVALLTDDQDRQVLLEHRIESTRGRIVFSRTGFLASSGDPVMREIQDSGARIVVVDVNPINLQPGLHTIEVIRDFAKEIGIIAVVGIPSSTDSVSVMRAGARVVTRDASKREWLDAFSEILGPQLVVHTKVGDIPTSWRCSACNEVFRSPLGADLNIGLREMMRVWVQHRSAEHAE